MKLIYCPKCRDVVKLISDKTRYCSCGEVFGKYTDNVNAAVAAHCIVLGFENSSFHHALDNAPIDPGRGLCFDAFLIPRDASSVIRMTIDEYFPPNSVDWENMDDNLEQEKG
jgi:hypothetical protein